MQEKTSKMAEEYTNGSSGRLKSRQTIRPQNAAPHNALNPKELRQRLIPRIFGIGFALFIDVNTILIGRKPCTT
jgi:hypothetical protein